MASSKAPADETELLDYEEEEEAVDGKTDANKEVKQGHYVGVHASGFRDFILKPEIMRAIVDCGFEHPSQVQHECIPNAVLGMDIICQAKSGMGKTAVFVVATLHQLVPQPGVVSALVLVHTRELAWQIANEYQRFCKYMSDVKVSVFYGGINISKDKETLKNNTPHIVVGTPGRIKALVKDQALKLDQLKFFVLDECDKLLEQLDMRKDVQDIFKATPHQKQVMMFSATLSKDVRGVCKRFCAENPKEVLIDDETKLTLHGLQQYYIKLAEAEKNRKLNDLLDALEFNQVVIFCSKLNRCTELTKLLVTCNFPAVFIHSGLKQEERIKRYQDFKAFHSRILVTTDLFGRGIDIERVNIVVNYDFPDNSDQYLHRVGRAGRFGTKGLAISFVSSKEDATLLQEVQGRFEVNIPELPDSIDTSTYMSQEA